MKKLLFIYNARAGKGKIKQTLPAILDCFTRAGYLVTAYPTQAKADATRIVAELGGEYDRVVCSGGDGTLNETISGLLEVENRPVLGYVPAGTTNDFSKNLMLPRGMEGAAETAVEGVPRPCDIGRFNGRPFVYVAAFGAFTDVSYDTPQEFKSMFGHLAYIMEGVTRLGSLKSYVLRVEHDGGIVEGEFLYGMVSNTISVGGFQGMPAEEVKLDDGLFEVLLVRQPKNANELQSIVVTLARQSPPPGGAVALFHTSRLKVTCAEPVPWTLDGEYGGAPAVVEIENCKHAITIVWGK
jgi:diacylglycerol kinase (ATP)